MAGKRFDPRSIVSAWTLFTTVFLWTPTMRMLFKPEISRWKVGVIEGSGRSGLWWLFPLAALLALMLFYLEGRGRLRSLFHFLLLSWHLPLTAAITYWSVSLGSSAVFEGGAWGVRIPLFVVAIPFFAGSILSIAWVGMESTGSLEWDIANWWDVRRGQIAGAVLLFLPAIVFYRWGEGFDWRIRIAISISVLQWILLAGGLQGRRSERS